MFYQPIILKNTIVDVLNLVESLNPTRRLNVDIATEILKMLCREVSTNSVVRATPIVQGVTIAQLAFAWCVKNLLRIPKIKHAQKIAINPILDHLL